MDLTFSDEQTMLRESLSRYLAKECDFDARQAVIAAGKPYDAKVWADLAEMGVLGLVYPEDRGGFGGSVVDAAAAAEILGARLSIEPFLPCVMLGGMTLALAEPREETSAILEGVVAGETLVAFAHEEGRGLAEPARVAMRADPASDGGLSLTGEKRYVLNAAESDWIVVTARASGAPGEREGLVLALVARDAPGLSLTEYRTADGRRAANLRFEGVQVPAARLLAGPSAGADLLDQVLARALVALCAEAVGAMGELLRLTADYARQRKQFGAPIGSFQALRHRLSNMYMAYEKARSTLICTAALVEAERHTMRDIRLMKAQTGRLGRELGEGAVQIHGGVGMTDELSVGHYFKRLLATEMMFGASRQHYRALGRG